MASRPRPESNRNVTRFAGGPPHRGRPRGHGAPGWDRTSGLLARNQVLSPLSYEGIGGSGRTRTCTATLVATGLQPAGPPVAQHSLGVTGGCRPRYLPGHSRALCRLSYSHHEYPRRVSNPRPPACRAGALPLSYPGKSGRAPGENRTDRSLRIRQVHHQVGSGAPSHSSGGRTRTCTGRGNNPLPYRLGDARSSSAYGTRTRSARVKASQPNP